MYYGAIREALQEEACILIEEPSRFELYEILSVIADYSPHGNHVRSNAFCGSLSLSCEDIRRMPTLEEVMCVAASTEASVRDGISSKGILLWPRLG